MGKYKMPKHFRWNLKCKECSGDIEADGHYSMSEMDAYLSIHLEAFGHNRYDLEIIKDESSKR